MKKTLLLGLLCFAIGSVQAQEWTLKDVGVGLIIEDANYDRELRIERRGSAWDIKELYEGGAMAGKYRGNQLFAAWISGPPTSSYTNRAGQPAWYWKYTIVYPDGKTAEAGPHGFYTPGFGYFGINTGGYTEGKWRIEFSIWNRDTKETRRVGSVEFQTSYGRQASPSGTGWDLRDLGVGIYDESEYDRVLKVISRGDAWSQKALYEQGFFSGRDKKVFGTWIEGPPINTYLNSAGVPLWLCLFVVTYPNGSRQESGPYNFYAPGFCTMFINACGNALGKWRIDYYLWHRDTKERKQVGTREFVMNQ